MRTGRYSYNAVQRSILRPIRRSMEPAEGFVSNCDCAVLQQADGSSLVTAAASVHLDIQEEEELRLAFYRVCNQIYGQRGKPQLLNALFALPETYEEERTARAVEQLAQLCSCEGIQVGLVTASVSSAVSQALVSLQATGRREEKANKNAAPGEGWGLLMTGHAGMAGTGLLASRGGAILTTRYTQGFIRQAQQFLLELSIRRAAELADGLETCLYPVQEGGVLGALWNFADGAGVGLDIDIRRLPIRQETVEISECYGINPYQLLSDGACLIAAKQPELVCERLREAGIRCSVIGHITSEKARIVRRDEEVRYLDKPAQDELERLRTTFRSM